MPKKLIPAVAYIRMSSGPQEKSPAQQRAEVARLAKRDGYKIIREYFDKAISGDDTARRTDFQRMIRDAEEKGDFAAILCWDQDRFGRFDSIEAGRWVYPLREAGIWLVTCCQGQVDWNDFAGRMFYSIQQEGKHQFLVDLSRNVLRGKIENAKNGKGATIPPWGYDRQYHDATGKPVKRVPYGEKFRKPRDWSMHFVESLDTEAVRTVRWMFDTLANTDCGMTWLASDLNRRGVPSPHGRRWSVQAVARIVTNRTYIGSNVFGRNRYGKYHHTGANGEITRGKGQHKPGVPIVTEGIHERLIEPLTFARVQAKLAERRREGRKPRYNRYLLSGVLRCGHCGAPMAGKGYHKGNVPRYYICTAGATRPGACHRYQVQQEALDDYVIGVLKDRLLAPDAVERIRKAIYRQAKSRQRSKGETRSVKAKIEALDQKIAKGTENLLLAEADDMADMSGLLADWRAERDRLQTELEGSATNPEGMTADRLAERAVAELDRLRVHLRTGDPMHVRGVVKSMVAEIRLWWEPYGKRSKRFTHGELRWRGGMELLSRAFRGR